jgi:hypothetical protein
MVASLTCMLKEMAKNWFDQNSALPDETRTLM